MSISNNEISPIHNKDNTDNFNTLIKKSNKENLKELKEKIKVKGDDMNRIIILGYSIGHFFNDICCACWFYFFSYYLVHILDLDETTAGYIVLGGQVSDAISTILTGILSDMTNTRFGKRIPWYFVGSIVVAITYTLIYQGCIICNDNTSYTIKFIYLLINPCIFNIAWAAVQVSHMALLPSITLSIKKQDRITRYRTGVNFSAQFIALILSLVIFYLVPQRNIQYRVLAAVCATLGITCTIIFLIFVKESELIKNIKSYYMTIKKIIREQDGNFNGYISSDFSDDEVNPVKQLQEIEDEEIKNINWKFWLSKIDFYVYMLVYMFVRMAINISSSLITFYCKNILKWQNKEDSTSVLISISLIILTVGSVINSLVLEEFLLKKFNPKKKRLAVFIIALFFMTIGCVPIYFLNNNNDWIYFILSFAIGIGYSAGLSGASVLINDVVGPYGSKGAFVYGLYSFCDKLSCGIVIFFMIDVAEKRYDLLKIFMGFFPPLSILLAFICVLIRYNNQNSVSQKSKKKKNVLNDSRITFI